MQAYLIILLLEKDKESLKSIHRCIFTNSLDSVVTMVVYAKCKPNWTTCNDVDPSDSKGPSSSCNL